MLHDVAFVASIGRGTKIISRRLTPMNADRFGAGAIVRFSDFMLHLVAWLGAAVRPFCNFSDFKERGMESFLHPAVTVARRQWEFGLSYGAGRLFSVQIAGVEIRHHRNF
jgi:hypothetical protein